MQRLSHTDPIIVLRLKRQQGILDIRMFWFKRKGGLGRFWRKMPPG